MRASRCANFRLGGACALGLASLVLNASRLPAQDCNRNGIPDDLDLGFPGELPAGPDELHSLAIAAADVDGDGRTDLVKAETALRGGATRSSVLVLLGNGDATFQFYQRFATGDWPWALVAADLSGDGRVDLATANRDSGDLSVLLGNGDGSFQAERRLGAGANVQALVAVDLDGDSDLDLASAGNESVDGVARSFVLVLLGNGDGTFNEQPRLSMTGRTASLAAGDFDGDGRQDLVAFNITGDDGFIRGIRGHRDPRDVVLLLGNGDGTFAAERRFLVSAGGSFPASVAAVDINGDGRLDVAVNYPFGAATLFGNGDGTLQATVFDSNVLGSPGAYVDWNRDGRLDLVTAETTDPNLAGGSRLNVYAGNGDGTFPLAQCIGLDVGIRALLVADLNGDGRDDVATANDNFSDVAIVLGYAGKGFVGFDSQGLTLATGFQPFALVAADLDGDGRLDLATANREWGELSVLLGNGDGSFEAERRYAAGRGPLAILALDLNGDARLDLAALNQFSSDVSVLLGNGDGTFQRQRRFATGRFPSAIAAADLNGDGRLDLATASAGPTALPALGEVSVLLGNGDGTFQTERRFLTGPAPVALIAADLNGDGRVDVATVHSGFHLQPPLIPVAPGLSVLLGNGDGTFQAERRLAEGLRGSRLVAADLNGDGRADLATGGHIQGLNGLILDGPGVYVLLGNGDGTFARGATLPVELNTQVRAALDLNGDGRADVVAHNPGNGVSAFLGNGDGTFQPERRFGVSGLGSTDLVAGDFDGDGAVDVATANSDSHDVSVIAGNGDGSFQAPERFAMGNLSLDSLSVLATADFDGDGFADIATASRGLTGDCVAVRLGSGDGTFQGAVTYHAGTSPIAVVAADLNSDGRPDLTVMNLDSRDVSVLLGNGDGTFQPQRRIAAREGRSPVISDFNGDGRLDLATVSQCCPSRLSVLLGMGDGTFGPARQIAVGVELYDFGLAAADLNGDQHLDLAVSTLESGGVLVLLGNGDGTFQPGATVDLGSFVREIIAEDFDRDGAMDLTGLPSHPSNPRCPTVALGNGDGTFRGSRCFSVGLAPYGIVAADLNGDALLDLSATNLESTDLSVLLGNGDGTFQVERRFARGNPGFALIAADFNGDGRSDLATANGNSADVSILLNKLGADWASPRLACPDAMVVRCASPDGAVVDFEASASDACDPSPSVSCDPPSGSTFPRGTTLVTCTGRDANGNQSQCRFEVTVSCGGRQRPGDSNQDAGADISDAIGLLGYLFLGSPARLPCGDGTSADRANRELLDWNGSAAIDLSDAVGLLHWLFQGGPPHAMGEDCREIEGCADACSLGGR